MIFINTKNILQELNGGNEDAELENLVNKYVEESSKVIFKYKYKIFKTDDVNYLLQGDDIKRYAKNSNEIAVFIVTLNVEADKKLRTLEKISKLDYIVYDKVISHLIEDKAELLQQEVHKELLENNKFALTRFSTGYGDYPIDVNYDIHKLLDANRLGVFLTDKNMFMPSKTISGIIAGGDEVKNFNFCTTCNITKECNLIKEGRKCYE